jgi:predicted GH43/DUF377 family glycosyl hydrolase
VEERVIQRISERLLLRPQDLKPLRDDFKIIGVFNPGAVKVNDEIILLARVAENPRDQRTGFLGLPRWKSNGTVVDWVSDSCD